MRCAWKGASAARRVFPARAGMCRAATGLCCARKGLELRRGVTHSCLLQLGDEGDAVILRLVALWSLIAALVSGSPGALGSRGTAAWGSVSSPCGRCSCPPKSLRCQQGSKRFGCCRARALYPAVAAQEGQWGLSLQGAIGGGTATAGAAAASLGDQPQCCGQCEPRAPVRATGRRKGGEWKGGRGPEGKEREECEPGTASACSAFLFERTERGDCAAFLPIVGSQIAVININLNPLLLYFFGFVRRTNF